MIFGKERPCNHEFTLGEHDVAGIGAMEPTDVGVAVVDGVGAKGKDEHSQWQAPQNAYQLDWASEPNARSNDTPASAKQDAPLTNLQQLAPIRGTAQCAVNVQFFQTRAVLHPVNDQPTNMPVSVVQPGHDHPS